MERPVGSDGWRYCRTHGKYYDPYDDGCDRCREAEADAIAQARDGVDETIRALEESDYRRANPGEYACPHCLYFTLKRGALRCPHCRGDVARDYWDKVRAREQAAEEERRRQEAATRAEWERGAPERKTKAIQARIAAVEEEIAACHKTIGLSIGVVAATFALAFGSEGLANQHANTNPPNLAGCLQGLLIALGSLGVIIFGLGLYAVVPIAAITIVVQLVRIGIRRGRIARIRSGADE